MNNYSERFMKCIAHHTVSLHDQLVILFRYYLVIGRHRIDWYLLMFEMNFNRVYIRPRKNSMNLGDNITII